MNVKKGQIFTIGDLINSYSKLHGNYKRNKSRHTLKLLKKIVSTKVTING